MTHTKALQDIEQTLEAYDQVDEEEVNVAVEELLELYTNSDDMTEKEHDLMERCFQLREVAETYFNAIYAAEEAEQIRDERAYINATR